MSVLMSKNIQKVLNKINDAADASKDSVMLSQTVVGVPIWTGTIPRQGMMMTNLFANPFKLRDLGEPSLRLHHC